MPENEPQHPLPGRAPKPPAAGLSAYAGAGAVTALGLFATDVGYGFLAYAGLGHGFANTGIVAAFLASVLGSLVPALVGGSGPSFGGPRPAQTLIFAALLAGLAGPGGTFDPARVAFVAMACVVQAGLIQAAFGLFDLGRIIRFTPLPVLAGFTNGVALSMMLGALAIIFSATGGQAGSGPGAVEVLSRLLVALALLLLMYRVQRRLPKLHWSLVGLAAGTLAYFAFGHWLPGLDLGEMLPAVAVATPSSGVAALDFTSAAGLDWRRDLLLALVPALSVATLNSLEALVIANQQDLVDGTRHDSRRLLLGQGLANCLCGLLGALPSAPSNSRQLVARQVGGHGRLASVAFAGTMAALLLMTPLFVAWIPKLAVAVLLLYMAGSIVDRWGRMQLRAWWRGEGNAEFQAQVRSNLAVMAVVMAVAVTVNLLAAMAAGVLLAMVLFVRHHSRSIVARVYPGDRRHSAVMRPLADMEVLRRQGGRIALVELSGPLFFGSGELLMDEVEALAGEVRHIILDFRQVGTIEASGAGAIQRIARQLGQRGITLALASITPEETRGRLIVESSVHNRLPAAVWYDDADLALEAAEDVLLAADQDAAGKPAGHGIDALHGLDAAQVAVLLEYTGRHRYGKGEALFRRGDPGDTLYLLLAGRIEIRVPLGEGGRFKRLVVLRAGAFFGEMAILRGAPRSADAIATADGSEALSLHEGDMARLHREHPDIALALMRDIGAHLSARLASVTDELRHALAGARE
ncbi:cyclic nucleotide-binding domain-containing protein [Parasulfuritortus cantonensis]|uniref:Cyclic nucleotide-binding domain-containing protein n=1 Tax=Parasulfuritortus cantonensis TaxID=2528202 RepID=A0A4R1BIQ1_9PROT|nr:SulP family inorganic anion transporter [Parasulfuritortus cantonensis]TCJ17170.1 cyclic nucleotide-binding domain-containing protein [Parasulfuritortus cantonensis]